LSFGHILGFHTDRLDRELVAVGGVAILDRARRTAVVEALATIRERRHVGQTTAAKARSFAHFDEIGGGKIKDLREMEWNKATTTTTVCQWDAATVAIELQQPLHARDDR
jgi:hypothetical protein